MLSHTMKELRATNKLWLLARGIIERKAEIRTKRSSLQILTDDYYDSSLRDIDREISAALERRAQIVALKLSKDDTLSRINRDIRGYERDVRELQELRSPLSLRRKFQDLRNAGVSRSVILELMEAFGIVKEQ